MFGPFLSRLTHTYILEVYCPRHDVTQPPPAIRHQRDGHRKYTKITPDAKWKIMEEAKESGVSLASALALQQQNEQYGNANSAGGPWIQKKLEMYSENRELRFADCKTVNLLVDQGKFDGKAFSFFVHYSWEKDEGGQFAGLAATGQPMVPPPLARPTRKTSHILLPKCASTCEHRCWQRGNMQGANTNANSNVRCEHRRTKVATD